MSDEVNPLRKRLQWLHYIVKNPETGKRFTYEQIHELAGVPPTTAHKLLGVEVSMQTDNPQVGTLRPLAAMYGVTLQFIDTAIPPDLQGEVGDPTLVDAWREEIQAAQALYNRSVGKTFVEQIQHIVAGENISAAVEALGEPEVAGIAFRASQLPPDQRAVIDRLLDAFIAEEVPPK